VQGSSSNVDESGNFSEGVLQTALLRHGVTLERADADVAAVLEDFSRVDALVCNLDNHWMALRRLGGVILNLNSLSKKPTVETEFHLSAFLGQLIQEGWAIFRVNGSLPAPLANPDAGGEPSAWIPWAALVPTAPSSSSSSSAASSAAARSGTGGPPAWRPDAELEDAIRASMGDFRDDLAERGLTEDDDADLVAAIAASLGQDGARGGGRGAPGVAVDVSSSSSARATDADDHDDDGSVGAIAADDDRADEAQEDDEGGEDGEDEELRRAIEASLRE
jgi:Josephin